MKSVDKTYDVCYILIEELVKTNSNKSKGADIMKIMFEIMINVSLAMLVSVALISIMAFVKKLCRAYLYNS